MSEFLDNVKAAFTKNPRDVLAVGEKSEPNGGYLPRQGREYLADRRRLIVGFAAAGLASKAAGVALIMAEAASNLPADSVASQLMASGAGLLGGVGLVGDAFAVREYLHSAGYYADQVQPYEQPAPTPPSQG